MSTPINSMDYKSDRVDTLPFISKQDTQAPSINQYVGVI